MRSNKGFTLVEIMIVVAIIGLLAAIALPSFIKARTESQKNACIENLRQIDSAKQQWAINDKQPPDATPAWADVLTYIKNGDQPECPAGGTYTINAVNVDPACSLAAVGHEL